MAERKPEDFDLLIKVMGMTTSDNENQALVAVRKANEILAKWGTTWGDVLRGKIKIVEDPFKNLNIPRETQAHPPTQGWAPQPKRPVTPPPPPQPVKSAAEIAAENRERVRRQQENERKLYEQRVRANVQKRRVKEIPLDDLI